MSHTEDQSAPVTISRRKRWPDRIAFLTLTLLPSLLCAGPLLRGAIPYFMDTMLYFFPLRVHAAHLVAQGEWPLWNRCLMAGMPLFENPQAALGYPLNWPMLLWPNGFWFTFPMLLQLGLWGALTMWALRTMGISRGAALWAGALCIAGGYGWSRLQFGNYMNVLPWWPLWLGAAWRWRERGHAPESRQGGLRWIAAGGAAVALMLLAGAHQLAAYGMAGLTLLALALVAMDFGFRRSWVAYLLSTLALGMALGAPGWLPQLGFIRETSRPEGLPAAQVLGGAMGSGDELLRAIGADWPSMDGIGPSNMTVNNGEEIARHQPFLERIRTAFEESVRMTPDEPWADAESTASIGVLALVLAGLMPPRGERRRLWIACWIAAGGTALLALRPVMAMLLAALPVVGIFHDPRRWLGVTQWLLIVASGISVDAWLRGEAGAAAQKMEGWLAARAGALLLLAAFAMAAIGEHNNVWLDMQFGIALIGLMITVRRSVPRAGILALGTAMLAHATWVTTPSWWRPAAKLLSPPAAPLIANAKLQRGERFFMLPILRGQPYDFQAGKVLDWSVPNLGMLRDLEDLGGYEPAQSVRYRDFMRNVHADEPSRQLYTSHFGLVTEPGARAEFDAANVHAAIMPRWGAPLFFQQTSPTLSIAQLPTSIRDEFFTAQPEVQYISSKIHDLFLTNGSYRIPVSMKRSGDSMISDELAIASATEKVPGRRPSSGVDVTLAQNFNRKSTPIDSKQRGPWFIEAISPWVMKAGVSEVGPTYVWDPAWSAFWKPLMVSGDAALERYTGAPSFTAWESGTGRVTNVAIRANRVDLKVNVERVGPRGAAQLVIHDAWWPGWRATIDGEPVEVKPYGLWRAIDVPAGKHTIVMSYHPPLVMWSLDIFGVGVLVLLTAAWHELRKNNADRREDAKEQRREEISDGS